MRYVALATDYDGTLARETRVEPATLEAMRVLRESGRKAVLVTGRQLEDLEHVFPQWRIFDRIVAENGAILRNPATGVDTRLADPPPRILVERLRARGVEPLSVGRSIIATREPHETTALQVIHELGLENQVIFNKGAVMVLPPGVSKATGVRAALEDLGISPRDTVAIGDAENDHALLAECEVAVAVQNALPMLKARAHWVTEGAEGSGVVELVRRMLATDLRDLETRLSRRAVPPG